MKPSFVIAADHRGVRLKAAVIQFLKSKSYRVQDLGAYSEDPVDYPDFAIKVGQAVAKGKAKQGIVICHSGIGVSISANKVKGIRAALCQTTEQAELARRHTDANVLALPAGYVTPRLAKKILSKWLASEFEGGRHERRIGKIKMYETDRASSNRNGGG